MPITKDQFVAKIKKAVGTDRVSQESGTRIRVEINRNDDRESFAKMIAKAHGGRVSSTKKTEVIFTGFMVMVKHVLPTKTSTKNGNVEFGLLREFQTKKVVTRSYTLNAPSPKEPDEAAFIATTNAFIKKIDEHLLHKEAEIMKV